MNLSNEGKYEVLKEELIMRLSTSRGKKIKQLLKLKEIENKILSQSDG